MLVVEGFSEVRKRAGGVSPRWTQGTKEDYGSSEVAIQDVDNAGYSPLACFWRTTSLEKSAP